MEGVLKVWKEDKGFGFISSPESKDIFIHISALKKMSRRPSVGDKITFELHTDNKGKVRAVNAHIHGVGLVNALPKRQPHKKESPKKSSSLLSSMLVLVVVIAGFQVYNRLTTPKVQDNSNFRVLSALPVSRKPTVSSFSCDGKVYCSEMTSCSEAKYYLNHCPGTKMDGDLDGVPCEQQFCNNYF